MIGIKHIEEFGNVCWTVAEHVFKILAWGVIVVAGRAFINNEHPEITWANIPLTLFWVVAVISAYIKSLIYIENLRTKTLSIYKEAHQRVFPESVKVSYVIYAMFTISTVGAAAITYYFLTSLDSAIDSLLGLVLPSGVLHR